MKILAITGGHSFDRAAFSALLDALPCEVTWVEQPEALQWFEDGRAAGYAVSLHYDMPGVRPVPEQPSRAYARELEALVDQGHGFVVLHHALASWPAWPRWAELVGGQYLYRPGVVRGVPWPDSGFRHDVQQQLTPTGPHPVLLGLDGGLDLVDETYLCPVFQEQVQPLLRSDARTDDAVHSSTAAAVAGAAGQQHAARWAHPPGCGLAAWTRTVGTSRLVYVQPGDTAATLGDARYQRLVANAVEWAGQRGR